MACHAVGGFVPRTSCTCMCSTMSSPTPQPGKCWLVGSGPGSTEHLTLKAANLIQNATVIVYDDLGTKGALDEYASPQAELRYVGKRGQKESIKQPDIDSLLVNLCQQGKDVVRLKGGCPSTFSRVGSELKALAAAGIPHEMVPGVSSALAAPILAGFTLTDAQMSTSYTVLTAHAPDKVDWAKFAGLDTLVLLMPARNLQLIMQCLLGTGWSPQTPVAVIKSAGTEQQRVWLATICTVGDKTQGEQLSPCIIVVGQVTQYALAANVGE